MKSRHALGCLLAMAIMAVPSPTVAQGPLIVPETELLLDTGEVLWTVGTWLANYLAGKAVDPLFDKVFGRDSEKKLQAVKVNLENRISQGAANRKQLEDQLATTKDELRMLRQLMAGGPSAKQREHDRKRLAADLKTIRSTLAEHEKKLAEHDKKLAQQNEAIESQGRMLSEMQQLLDLQRPLSERHSPPPPRSIGGPSIGRPSRPSGNPFQSGASLRIQVKGRANLIRLREATHPVAMGIFRLSREHMEAAYFLPPEARAVVELFAPANRISMPARLARQVKILSHGWYYETLLY
jgi:hypothetical protein